jgi:2-oxoglutarate ferredoxin oxidoreductase subunit delta
MNYIEINKEKCKGCELCIEACPAGVIALAGEFNKKGWQFAVPVNNDKCTGCRQCAIICPDIAIMVYKEK